MPPRTDERGNALVVAMIAMAVLMVVVVGAIQFTGFNREAAAAKTRGDRLGACTEAARRHLLSRLRVFGIKVTELMANPVNLADDPDVAQQTVMSAAHYAGDGGTAGPTIVPVQGSAFGAARKQVRELSNTLPGTGTLGGQYYRVVMKCLEPGGREQEIEFVFRHGL